MLRDKALSQVLYSLNRIAALALLLKCSQNYLMGWKDELEVPVSFELALFIINVVLQLVELGLTFAGKVKGNSWRFFGLLVNKILLAFFFLSNQSDRFLVILLGLAYGLTDTFKYWHLLFPKHRYLSDIRFTVPLITGLIIPYLSLSLMNDYIKIHAETISYALVNYIRIVQLFSIVNYFFSYRTLLLQKQEFDALSADKTE
jgi:hypothetical protein